MAWYHPIPRLGAPQPKRMTSACPSLAKLTWEFLVKARLVLVDKKALADRREDEARRENIMMIVVMKVVVVLVVSFIVVESDLERARAT